MKKLIFVTMVFTLLGCTQVNSQVVSNSMTGYKGTGVVTQGAATVANPSLFTCHGGRSRVAAVGLQVDAHSNKWTVPSANQFLSANHAPDLFNECSGVTPSDLSQIDIDAIPAIEIDADGEVVIGYLFADNYFELYINGKLVGVDAVPFTPFNSSLVKFKVKKPYNIAVKLVDWEENLGLGSENNRGKKYHAGDGGFIASFSDGTVTNSEWLAQTFYTSPIYDLSCLKEQDQIRDSSTCFAGGTDDGASAYAVHWPLPENWEKKLFDYSHWPQAITYTEDDIGVENKKAYMNFREKFAGAGAEFIWSSNVVLDNQVLLRYQVD
ncbi:hypothetical protein [Oceanospirillum maris]|uniref:hypothetical protein n=1 Tax=Oceanospirillum maris TaxID=64977 RepID=UPI0004883DA8|nr:hypothetical protein [Oceanospirillum maris]